MARQPYRYQLLRYVPDLERMEPINIGIVVQSDDGIDHKINGRFRPDSRVRGDFDRANFRAWRQFFAVELRSRGGQGFAPKRSSVEFLEYLMSRCRGNYQLTEPLALEATEAHLSTLRDQLYERLVVRGPEDGAERATAPVSRFREDLEERRLDRRFAGVLHHNEDVVLGGVQQAYYYWFQNGRTVLIDKVEVGTQVRYTQLELEGFLGRLAALESVRQRFEVVAIIDPASKLPPPESDSDWLFRSRYVRQCEEIKEKATRVVDTADLASGFVAELEHELQAAGAAHP